MTTSLGWSWLLHMYEEQDAYDYDPNDLFLLFTRDSVGGHNRPQVISIKPPNNKQYKVLLSKHPPHIEHRTTIFGVCEGFYHHVEKFS
jgi:hypothetical protein